jgi:hypothetical protein
MRLTAALQAWKKWWELLWVHPTYITATTLHPEYRTVIIDQIGKSEKLTKDQIAQKQEVARNYWIKWKSSYEKKQASLREQPEALRQRRTTLVQQATDTSVKGTLSLMFDTSFRSTESYDEWARFQAITLTGVEKKPLDFWRHPIQEREFPILTQLALELFGIIPMSDECERCFSRARRTCSWERGSLQAEMLESLECLGHRRIEIDKYTKENPY